MICNPCKEGAAAMLNGQISDAIRYHSVCLSVYDGPKPTKCDCQHDVSGTALNPALLTTVSPSGNI